MKVEGREVFRKSMRREVKPSDASCEGKREFGLRWRFLIEV